MNLHFCWLSLPVLEQVVAIRFGTNTNKIFAYIVKHCATILLDIASDSELKRTITLFQLYLELAESVRNFTKGHLHENVPHIYSVSIQTVVSDIPGAFLSIRRACTYEQTAELLDFIIPLFKSYVAVTQIPIDKQAVWRVKYHPLRNTFGILITLFCQIEWHRNQIYYALRNIYVGCWSVGATKTSENINSCKNKAS